MRIVAVVVAYNRRELLLECLGALRSQTRRLDSVLVIDNGSTDDTADAVRNTFPEVDLRRLEANTGGAGGFAIGIANAIASQSADLVWVMDDDTIPTPTALEALLSARSAARVTPAILASRVVWTDGLDHPMNTPRSKPLAGRFERREAASVGCVPVRSASFVSMLVSAEAVRAAGLPIGDYFIWNDDFEFSARLLRHCRGLFVPNSVVVHKTKARADTDADPGERFYYEVRNKLWLFRASPALAWYEKPLYGASTARRWIRTYARSHDRETLTRTFRHGWRDGLRSRPRSNDAYLASLGVEDATVATVESSVR